VCVINFRIIIIIINKATRVLGIIKRTIRYKDTRVMMSLYKTLVRPHVEYCVSAWNPHYVKDKKLIEKVQRRFTKMTNNMEGKTYQERLQCLKLWTLEEGRNRQDLIEVFKICNVMSRIKLNELFTLDDNIKATRGYSWKLAKLWCTRDCCIFSPIA